VGAAGGVWVGRPAGAAGGRCGHVRAGVGSPRGEPEQPLRFDLLALRPQPASAWIFEPSSSASANRLRPLVAVSKPQLIARSCARAAGVPGPIGFNVAAVSKHCAPLSCGGRDAASQPVWATIGAYARVWWRHRHGRVDMGAVLFWLGIGLVIALVLLAVRAFDRRARRRGHHLRSGGDIFRDAWEHGRDTEASAETAHMNSDHSWTSRSRRTEGPS
jgi:hypothetical protein